MRFELKHFFDIHLIIIILIKTFVTAKQTIWHADSTVRPLFTSRNFQINPHVFKHELHFLFKQLDNLFSS